MHKYNYFLKKTGMKAGDTSSINIYKFIYI